MIHRDKVLGTQTTVSSLEVNVDTVYIRTNIKRIESDDFTGWQYDEIQCSLREYQESVGKKTNTLGIDVNVVGEMLSISLEDSLITAETLSDLMLGFETLKQEVLALKGGN